MKGLNGKKGLIAIALLMAGIMALPFATQFYTWSVSYTINPLTTNSSGVIAIPATTGATSASGISLTGTIPSITLDKAAYVHFYVSSADTTALAANYWNLAITITVDGATPVTLTLVSGGVAQGSVDVGTASIGPGGPFAVTITATYWTSAVSGTVTGSFTLNVYAVES